jgi:hypothetical protein
MGVSFVDFGMEWHFGFWLFLVLLLGGGWMLVTSAVWRVAACHFGVCVVDDS